MGRSKKHHKSLKECENIHVFMRNWYGVKSHHRKRTKFHHNDMPLYLLNRGITPPSSVCMDEALKYEDNSVIFVRDDKKNIRCYKNHLAVNKWELLETSLKTSEDEKLKLRRQALKSEGFDYDPCTGEVMPLEELEYLDWVYNLTPTEKVNRQGHQKVKR